MYNANVAVAVPNKQTGFVYILESPSSDDLLEGRQEGRALKEALTVAGIQSEHCIVTDRQSFYKAIGQRLVDAIKKQNRWPVIHFSGHGNADGLGLTHDSQLTWDELHHAFAPINSIIPGGLILCFSACSGFAGVRMAMYEDKAPPFAALVGNERNVMWDDAAIAYIAFYHRLFKEGNLGTAIEAMKAASGDYNFYAQTGEGARRGYVEYLAQQRQEEFMRNLSDLLRQYPQLNVPGTEPFPGPTTPSSPLASSPQAPQAQPPSGIVMGTRVPVGRSK